MNAHQKMIERAEAILTERKNRSEYARDVLCGRQRWSGADLKGKAKRYGASYAHQRANARKAVEDAGGFLIASLPHGLIVSAVAVGQDDYGNALYRAADGVYVQASAANARCLGA